MKIKNLEPAKRGDSAPAPGPAPGLTPKRGHESRATILQTAAQLATLHGLQGLSIGELAAHLGMSKSGLYAHFKSKEDLELATIQTASEIFEREVLRPALTAAPGIPRLLALVDEFLSHLRRRVFPGGCFFAAAAAELATRPGPAHDQVTQIVQQWLGLFEEAVREAQSRSEIDPAADANQIVFEVEAMNLAANVLFVLTGDENRLIQARRGVEDVLKRVAVLPA